MGPPLGWLLPLDAQSRETPFPAVVVGVHATLLRHLAALRWAGLPALN